MNNTELKQQSAKYIAPTYAKKDAVLAKGRGATAWDNDGKKYIDFTSGVGVNSLGFSDDGYVKAVTRQLEALQHTCNLFYHAQDASLAQKLCEKSGMQKVFFCNSGAEANEGAIKWARKYGEDKKGKQCFRIVTLTDSFHGRTITTLAATGQDGFHTKFHPLTDGFVHAKSGDIDDLLSKLTDDTCAVLFEIVQGEGGVNVLDAEYVKAMVAACRAKDILVIIDEVQTGIGRTGMLFAYEQYGIKPDIITLAKGLGGGLPVGAILLGEAVQNVLGAGDHGSTFGGNPVSCAAANYVLDTITPKFLDEVNAKAKVISQRLKAIDGVELSGLGLMIGISKDGMDAGKVLSECSNKGLLVLTAKQKVRLLPPLNITMDELKIGLDILCGILEKL